MDLNRWLHPEFWAGVLRDTVHWAIEAGPKLLIVSLGLFVTLKLIAVGLRRLRSYLVAHHHDTSAALLVEHEKRVDTLMGIARKVGVITAWTIFVMLFLVQVGINVGPLIAGAGVIGLAVGFGSQELVRDVITGFFMLLENLIRVGDVAVINGTSGTVETIGLRTLTLRDQSGTVHVFQNGKVNSLSNKTKGWSAMVFEIGVPYDEDTDRVRDVMKDVAEQLRAEADYGSKILEPMEVFGVEDFGADAVIIKARIKTAPSQQWVVGREYRRRLKKAFDEKGIEFPFPQRTLSFAGAPLGVRLHDGAQGTEEDAGEDSDSNGRAHSPAVRQ